MSNKSIPECFISYCSDDTDESSIKEIIEKLRALSSGIVFYYDKENHAGDNIEEFMKKINSVDTILVICSKAYNEKAMKKGTRINTEFSYMQDRYNMIKKRCERRGEKFNLSNHFNIIPIIISIDGEPIDWESSYPAWFQNELNLVFTTYFYISSTTKFEILNLSLGGEKKGKHEKHLIALKNKLNDFNKSNDKLITKIISKTIAINAHCTITDEGISKQTKIHRLIELTKAEVTPINLGSLFCKTRFYHDLELQTKNIFVGRKGSGKTETIRQYCLENRTKYKGAISINANDINLEELVQNYIDSKNSYSIFINELLPNSRNINLESTKHDIEAIFSYEVLLRYSWIGFIYLNAIYRIACEDLNENQQSNFSSANKFINQLLSKIDKSQRFLPDPSIQRRITKTLYVYAFTSCIEFFDKLITSDKTTSYTKLRSNIELYNSPDNYINMLLRGNSSRKTLSTNKPVSRKSFARTILHCVKRIFISLDGFDNLQAEKKGDRLRTKSLDAKFINDFESAWILALVNVVNEIKQETFNTELVELKGKLDICLMIPFDRYIQCTNYKRDGFIYRNQITAAIYKGHDLYDIYIKRLWEIVKETNDEPLYIETEEDRNIVVRKMTTIFTNLPQNITIELSKGKQSSIPLFLYILRYTFWRPRDIIDYIRYVFRVYFDSEAFNTNIAVTEATVKNSISICSNKIVMQIIEEFKDIWVNISDCLNKISSHNVLYTYIEFIDFIKSIGFVIQLSNKEEITKPNDIVKFLYEIGIIGLILSKENMRKIRSDFKQHQVFFSGRRSLSNLSDSTFTQNSIFFNLIFVDYCHLNINTDEILGIDNWTDLYKLDQEIDYDYINTPI